MLPIEFVSEEEQLVALRETGRPSPGPGEYQTWEKLHDALVAVAEEYGSASERPNPLPDIYHTGDWFDEYRDGFTLPTTKGLTAQALREFQVAVAAHHPRASLALVGQADEIKGLRIHISASQILVAWDGEKAEKCRQKLERIGLRLD